MSLERKLENRIKKKQEERDALLSQAADLKAKAREIDAHISGLEEAKN